VDWQEANKILQAMNAKLWMPSKGWYAEFKDPLGHQLLHTAPGLWTIYHAIDEHAADPFQAYQSLQYIDHNMPHIPVKAKGLARDDLYVLSTTNWQPYAWSLNNVALAESQHTALAYWQGQRYDEGYKIWESSLIESMYLGASPGGFQQLSFYDAVRGELYRDFADGIDMTARALVEGLFGVQPDGLHNTLVVQPRWPSQWTHALLSVPDIKIDFERSGNSDVYTIIPSFKKQMQLRFLVRAKTASIKSILINNKSVTWKNMDDAIGAPVIEITSAYKDKYVIQIVWQGNEADKPSLRKKYAKGSALSVNFPHAIVQKIFNPQNILLNAQAKGNSLQATIIGDAGHHTAFVQLKQNGLVWWAPLDVNIKDNAKDITSQPRAASVLSPNQQMDMVDLSKFFNDKVTQIFKNQYLSPRPNVPTLQLPTQGIGEWTHPLITANIDDSGLRKLAGEKNTINVSQGIRFRTPSDTTARTSSLHRSGRTIHTKLQYN
jgi:hypothetical protein